MDTGTALMISLLRNVWKNRRLVGDRRWCSDRHICDSPVKLDRCAGIERRQGAGSRKVDDRPETVQ